MTEVDLTFAVYAFEGLGPELSSPPIAARRALDHAGLRLLPEGWRSLSIDARAGLTAAGACDEIDVAAVARLAEEATPAPSRAARKLDPTPDDFVEPVEGLAAWSELRPLDRYAIQHVRTRAAARSEYGALADAEATVLASARAAPRLLPELVEPMAAPTDDPPTLNVPLEPLVSPHLTTAGEVHMIDVGPKAPTSRRAVARGSVRMRQATLERLAHDAVPKGEVLATARVAGILAAKRTPELIPLCHHVALTRVEVQLELRTEEEGGVVDVTASVDALDRTGCEMEALVAVSTACLTVYDMLKGIDRDLEIRSIVLLEKDGGRSGHYLRGADRS